MVVWIRDIEQDVGDGTSVVDPGFHEGGAVWRGRHTEGGEGVGGISSGSP